MIITTLAELYADIDMLDNHGYTPTTFLRYECHAEVMELLADLGANVETTRLHDLTNSGIMPISIAAQKNDVEVTRLLTELVTKVETLDNDCRIPV